VGWSSSYPTATNNRVGLLGTYLPNVGRVIGLLVLGHQHGATALWAAHEDACYPLFIAWYALFAGSYFWVVGRSRGQAVG
jgi:hypothetical protein